jgi:RNA polymerase sigma-70 factor (ECF subfamily)
MSNATASFTATSYSIRQPGHSVEEEAALVDRLIADDPRAWQEFTARYSRLIYGCIQRIIRRFPSLGPEDAREIYASFCLQLIANDKRKLRLFRLDRGARLSTWISLLTSNATYDYLRSVRREPCRTSVADTERLSCSMPDPSQIVEGRQRANRVAGLLSGFSERDQKFMMLYYGEGLSPESIAETLGISVKTVYSKKHKIRTRLESALTGQPLAA